jgi:hypothetical protein
MMQVKIGKFCYLLKEGDKFMDNGACVQLMTQSQEKCFDFSVRRPCPIVSKKVWKEILKNLNYVKQNKENGSYSIFTIIGDN